MTDSATDSSASRRRTIFVPARGQYENVGDILLRRQLLDWARESGPLHVYLGWSPPGYAEGLRLQPSDVQYRSFLRWYLVALWQSLRGTASYVFKPGEIQLTLAGMKEHVSMLPVIALVRARGGTVARIGVGSRNFASIPRALMWPSIALSTLSVWRDSETARYLGRGQVMPDLAFGEVSTELVSRRPELLVISLRSDLGERPYPGSEWISAVQNFAQLHSLALFTVTQVHVDEERNRRLAELLGAQFLGWDGADHHLQEIRLRELYRQSAVVVSDRLHVLVAAITEGAVPVGLLLDSSDKIARHFSAAGMPGIGINAGALSAGEIAAHLETSLARRFELIALLRSAQKQLNLVRERLGTALTSAPTRR
ncbi:MAG: polysaccharide pyruvyl transferase family protein [Microbacteriaceae bacterium]|nr:polysaccharide pyruvyl transferase family protein [Microbacteriaceae bacterium]